MAFFWILLVGIGVVALFLMGARMTGGGRGRGAATGRREGRGGRDLGANINPSQTGNQVNLWPDRTGPRTRRELGARSATDRTFTGEREEHNKAMPGLKGEAPSPQPGVRREVADGRVEPRGDQAAGAAGGDRPADGGLDAEAALGEDRPANRTAAPDQPPTQWHPRAHGVPGDHIRDGHHRSATAPERKSDARDPYAHAPVPGPSHIPPEGGADLPEEIRP